MKQIIYKSLFMLCFLMASMISIKAQDVSSAAFVKTNSELDGMGPERMSDNGRYIICNIGSTYDNVAKLWDTQLDIVTLVGIDCHGFDVSNDGVVVGEFLNPDILHNNGNGDMVPTLTGGFWKDNKWTMVQLNPDYTNPQPSSYGCVMRISSDGKWMGGSIFYADGGLQKVGIWNEKGEFVRAFGMEGVTKKRAGLRVISDDGMKAAGWSEVVDDVYYFGDWTATYWNCETDKTITVYPGSGLDYFEGMNNAGTIAVGYSGTDGIIAKEDGTITRMGGNRFMDVSETGMYVGEKIYTEKFGIHSIADYLKTFYGVESSLPPEHVVSISDNGEYMCLRTIPGPYGWSTAFARVSGDMLPTVPNKVAIMGGEKTSVNITWELPMFNGYNPVGYNVYRDGVKINTTTIKTLTFNDPSPIVGKNCYSVTAVFKYREEDKELESEKSASQCVEVISEDGCFSPKKTAVSIEYNRTVKLEWQRPSPNYKNSAKEDGGTPEPVKIRPDMLKKISNLGSAMHATSDGEFIYMMQGRIGKYALNGESMGTINTDFGLFPLRGITYDNDKNKFYTCVYESIMTLNTMTGGEEGTDVKTEDLGLGGFTRIAYLPFLDGGKGGFEVGDFGSKKSYYIDRDFKEIEGGGIPGGGDIRGVTHYNGIIYVAKRDVDKSMKIYLYDAETNKATGEYIDMRDYTNLNLTAVNNIWGVSVMNSSEGIPCLTVLMAELVDGWKDNNFMVFLELGEMEGLKGYNVYKGSVKITPEPIKTTWFNDKVFDAGEYIYNITAAYDNGCESSYSEPVKATITPIGTVNAPKNISAEIVRNNIIISWEKPASSSIPKLVGYNISRDGVQINKDGEYITNTFYVDKDLLLKDYKYTVTAFYNNSGVSAKVETVVPLQGFNPILPPTNVELETGNRGSVSLSWKAPAMGNYELKTWNVGTIENKIGILGGGTIYVASKWEAEDLNSVFDYTLTDIEFYPTINIAHTFYVYVDGEIVSTQEVSSVAPNQYNLLKLDRAVSIKKGKSLMIAYKVTHKDNEYPIGTDRRENIIGKGDLTSEDGINWYSSSIDNLVGNWAITIRLMPYSTPATAKIEDIVMENNGGKDIKLISTEMTRGAASEQILKNTEVTGYNVYKNNVKVNTNPVEVESFKDSSADLSIDNCYSIEALFTANRISPKSQSVCTFGHCLVPAFTGEIVNNYPELKLSTPEAIMETNELRFYDEEKIAAVGLASKDPFYALLQYTPAEIETFDGCNITGIKAFIDAECKLWLVVKQGDKIVLEKAVPASNITIGEMNNFVLNKAIEIDGTKSLLIGLKVQIASDVYPIGIDAGPGISFKGDVVAMNLNQLSSLKLSSNGAIDANWNISVSLEKSTKLEEENIGYNIYRDNVKINEEAFVGTIYVDKSAEGGKTYIYHATALWDTNCESEASAKVNLQTSVGVNDLTSANVKVYPNPAKDILKIEGDIETVRFYNSVGQECGKFSGNEKQGTRDYHQYSQITVDVSNWSRGIYIIEVTSTTGEVSREKVIIN